MSPARRENAGALEFLLECIGFPPDTNVADLARHILREGDPTPWRGKDGRHLRLPLAGGLEVQLDQELQGELPTLWPHYRPRRRLRVEVQRVREVPDSPFDAFLIGVANPRHPGDPPELAAEYPLATYLTDRRRLPRDLERGHVLALSLAGFALDVSWVGPNDQARDPSVYELPYGAALHPLGGADEPGGCMEVSARVREVRHLMNPLTGIPVEVLEIDAPGRPLELFLSRWQLEVDGLPAPRPGWRVEGSFLFTGRVAGGLPPVRPRRAEHFG